MNCPRCGERMYGSVCPKCGNVVVTGKPYTPRTAASRSGTDNIKYMDSSTRTVKPSKKRKSSPNNQLLKLIIVVLAVICVVLFFKYRSAASKLSEAEATINTQNETIKAKDEEITQLKSQPEQTDDVSADEDGSAPTVEFDDNGNLVNITEGSDSDSSDSNKDEDSDKSEYKSGDTYTIKDGDTGMSICKKVYGEYKDELWEKLLSANDMTTSSSFHPGDELKIP